MAGMRRIGILLLMISLLGVQTVYAKDYVKCATYFSDACPMNFWNSEHVHMEEEFTQIMQDGFNGIILVIPWREFQPSMSPISYNERAFQMLEQVMKAAEEAGLMVYLRIGYVWDYYNTQESCLERYRELVTDKTVRNAWLDYAKNMYQAANRHPNFAGGFITWEDFWNFTDLSFVDRTSSKGLEIAQKSGYVSYALEKYSIEQLSNLYEEPVREYRLPFPKPGTMAMKVFYDYYDTFLMELLEETQQVFPGLSMEVRTDADYLSSSDGQTMYYGHQKTYEAGQASYTAMMYGIPMGFDNQGQTVSARDAAKMTETVFDKISKESSKPLFVEQFLFVDTTPGYENNVQVRPDELNQYLGMSADILKRYSMGYGIWTYQNYCDNKVYNAQFGLGDEHWRRNDKTEVVYQDANHKMLLKKGGMISQFVYDTVPYHQPVYVEFLAECEEMAEVSVTVGRQKKSVSISENQNVTLTFHGDELSYVMWESDSEVCLDNIKVYTYIQDGKLYDMNGQELGSIDAVRRINRQLS